LNKKELSLGTALLPILVLVALLSYNVWVYGDDALSGSNQFILLIGGAFAAVIGFVKKISYNRMIQKVAENLQSVTGALLILLFVGALAGTWLISGIIPAMIYYGLQILHPSVFLPACIIICAIISLATGSSWTTSATVGIALIGIGTVLQIPAGMVAGAVISGAYFGDKLSPLSDTTNLGSGYGRRRTLYTHSLYDLYDCSQYCHHSTCIFNSQSHPRYCWWSRYGKLNARNQGKIHHQSLAFSCTRHGHCFNR
jgi:NhaC family Na+:H+ antiporter